MLVCGKWVGSSRRERSTVVPSLLIISLTICDSGRFLTPQEDVFFLHAISMSELIHLILCRGVLPDEPPRVINISITHIGVIAIEGDGGVVASKLITDIAIVEFSIKAFSQGSLGRDVSTLISRVKGL